MRMPRNSPDHAAHTEKAPLIVTLHSSCVVAGTGQTITVEAPAGYDYSWGTIYSDNSAHASYGSYGLGKMPPSGAFTHAWAIPADAPLGEARVDTAVLGKTASGKHATAIDHHYFSIKTSC
ncbi:MAG: hypothetical protein NVSMB57_15640 [Actinomycetota bacterium]